MHNEAKSATNHSASQRAWRSVMWSSFSWPFHPPNNIICALNPVINPGRVSNGHGRQQQIQHQARVNLADPLFRQDCGRMAAYSWLREAQPLLVNRPVTNPNWCGNGLFIWLLEFIPISCHHISSVWIRTTFILKNDPSGSNKTLESGDICSIFETIHVGR